MSVTGRACAAPGCPTGSRPSLLECDDFLPWTSVSDVAPPSAAHAPVRLLVASGDPALAADLRAAWGEGGAVEAAEGIAHAQVRVCAGGIDAVLVTPRLAQGSGNALLGILKRDAPQVLRCLLLDDGSDAPALAAVDNVHRLFHPPLDAAALLAALRAVRSLRLRLDRPDLAQAIGRIGRLPPPPTLSLELMRRTEPEAPAREIAALVQSDPALAVKVLRLCNSAMYSGGRRIDDIHAAVLWLGHVTLRRLVLAGEVFGTIRGRAGEDPARPLRAQSLLASRLAAALLPGPSADLAATAALLAGVGRLLPDVRLPDAGGGEADRPGYAEAGAYLLGLWGLPDVLVQAAALHPTPALAGEAGLGVIGACHVAWALAGGIPLDEPWLRAQGLDGQRDDWDALLARCRDED